MTRAVSRTPVRNSILAALLATEYKRILPRLEHVVLKRGDVVYRADQDIKAVYFPEEAVIAMVDTTDDRRTVEGRAHRPRRARRHQYLPRRCRHP